MATSTLVQYLDTSAVSASGAVVQVGNSPSNRRQVETFLTETAITVGQLVAIDAAKLATDASGGLTAATVITADFNSVPVRKVVVGVALESKTGTATSPQPIRICVRGVVTGVVTTGATAVGDALVLDTTGVAGACAIAVAADVHPPIGYALTVAAAGTCTAYIRGLFN